MHSLVFELQEYLEVLEANPTESIHAMRKRTKFIRALLRLDPDSPETLDGQLKTFSRKIAPYRDAVVDLQTYDHVVELYPHLHDDRIKATILGNPYLDPQKFSPGDYAELTELAMDIQKQMDSAILNPSDQLIYLRTYKTHKSGKKGFKRVKKNTDSEIVHTWRKRTKRLWYQLRFQFGDAPEDMNHPVNLCDTLGSSLGEIHDLDNLMNLFPLENHTRFREIINDHRHELLREAIGHGEGLYFQWDAEIFPAQSNPK